VAQFVVFMYVSTFTFLDIRSWQGILSTELSRTSLIFARC